MLAQSQQLQCMETHIFASHGLKHLLQLDSELLDVIDDDTWLREEKGGGETRYTSLSFSPASSQVFIVINQGYSA